MPQGIDVSRWQLYIDYPTVRGAGVEWFAAKATHGTGSVDPFWQRNRDGAEGSPFRARLAYHWLTPSGSIAQQAANWCAVVGTQEGVWRPMCDAEESGVTAAMVAEWCDRVEQQCGMAAAVYTGVYVAGGTIWRSPVVFDEDAGRPRILAAYVSEARMRQLCAENGGWLPDVWQNLGDSGRCNGVARRTPTGPIESLPCDNDVVLDWSKFDAVCERDEVAV